MEPSDTSRTYAINHYKVPTIDSTIEKYKSDEKFELIIATHVLEHLYNPKIVLEKISKNLTEDGYLLIEVPLWEKEYLQPIGVLSFEHLNYFCEKSLTSIVETSGYQILHLSKNYNINQYPVITIVAKKIEVQKKQLVLIIKRIRKYLFLILRERRFSGKI
ncbi:class I SAM-dependent methyltransferase [Shewanella dokdonensis]|uniref:class I SAM-dependent methyltransferase n=1 Tax=Shewanella dokdonensis TaxID=712036 RepID=UPI003CC80930